MKDDLIELGLSDRDHPSGLIDRLLSILSDAAVDGDVLKTPEFRIQLRTCRRRLQLSPAGTAGFARYSAECLRICEDFYERSRRYLLDRETEFAGVIEVLREALGRLAGESNSFSVQLIRTSDRMGRLCDIQDIRELKKQISLEVRELKRVVDEKQKQDEASFARLSKRVELLQTSLAQSREEASLDGLTRVANRRSFDRALNRWIVAHNRTKTSFVLALLDLDDFKSINDTHGHQVGDRVLMCAAESLSKCVRANDFLARFGGEEFAVLLSDVTAEQANTKFTEVLARIARSSYDYKVANKYKTVSFTVSCGLAEFVLEEVAENLLRRADGALYAAKNAGKNRVVTSDPPKKAKGLWRALQPLVPFRS